MQDPRYARSKFLLNCVEPGFKVFILVKFGKGANAIFITVYPSCVFSLVRKYSNFLAFGHVS